MEWSMLIQSPQTGDTLLSAFNNWHVQKQAFRVKPDISSSLGSCIRAKPSTGLILPILCIADLIVLYYRRIAEWKYVFKLLPAALVGFILALLVDRLYHQQRSNILWEDVLPSCCSLCFGPSGKEKRTNFRLVGGMGRFSDF